MAWAKFIKRAKDEADIRSWYSPSDPELSEDFQHEREKRELKILRWGMFVAVIIFTAYSILDLYLLPDIGLKLMATRILLGCSFLLLMEWAIKNKVELQRLQKIATTAIVIGACGWLLMASQTEYTAALSNYIVFGTAFVLGANLFFNFRFWLSATASIFVASFFILSIILYLDFDATQQIVLCLFFASCLFLSLYLSWQLSQERYNSFIHSVEARIQERIIVKKSEQLTVIANTDPLTGLHNRRFIAQAFEHFKHQAKKDMQKIGIALIDVDYFKRYNDTYGHKEGDNCLVKLAEVFEQIAAQHDAVIGRHGGEEFILLCKTSNGKALLKITNAIRKKVEALKIAHENRDDNSTIVTISVGASVAANDEECNLDILTQQADHALYFSKYEGRACSTLYNKKTHFDVSANAKISSALKQAIKKELISVVYQPIYDSASKQLYGYETLMRLTDSEGQPISPVQFIPVAEQLGSINAMGIWVIEQVCDDIAHNRITGTISINVSAVQLKNQNFALQVAAIIGKTNVSPHSIALEITEGQNAFEHQNARYNLNALRQLGMQIWLDDFGTGYAGLSWLDEFKFDIVKIDRSFLSNSNNKEGRRFLSDIIDLLRNRNINVLCEGVENQMQRDLLNELKVSLIQGYLIGKPLSIDKLIPSAKAMAY